MERRERAHDDKHAEEIKQEKRGRGNYGEKIQIKVEHHVEEVSVARTQPKTQDKKVCEWCGKGPDTQQ